MASDRMKRRLDALRAAAEEMRRTDPTREFTDWTLDDQLAQVECKLRFFAGFHSSEADKHVRYKATDREIHVLGIWCAVWQYRRRVLGENLVSLGEGGDVGDLGGAGHIGHDFEYTFERSGLTIDITPTTPGEPEGPLTLSMPRRIVLDDLPEWLLDHFERMPPEEQPKRDEYLYERRHAAKEDLEGLRTARCRSSEPMRTCSYERLLSRPQTKDSFCRRRRHVQGPSGSYLLCEPLLGQTLRREGPPGRIAGPQEETRICSEARR